MTLKPGLGSLKDIKNYTIQSGTHDFPLTFDSNHQLILHRFRDEQRFPPKIANPPPPVLNAQMNLVSAQGVPNASVMGLPDGRKSFKIGLVVCRFDTIPAVTDSQPPSHVAVAYTALTMSRDAFVQMQ